jgi:phosphate transport system permease protein
VTLVSKRSSSGDKEPGSFVGFHGLPVPRKLTTKLSASDHAFRWIARGGGVLVLALMLAVGSFLAFRATQALHKAGFSFLTTQSWNPDGGGFGIAGVMLGTILIALVAIIVAIPLALGVAVYIAEYAPRQIQRPLTIGIDLMAAVPSVVLALWGFFLLQWKMTSLSRWIHDWFSWIPLFQDKAIPANDPLQTASYFTDSMFIVGVAVALLVVPIAASIMREAFSQAPPGEREGAYALGATRWGMIRAVVLPFGKGAIIGGTMLGLGRALGETIVVASIISFVPAIQTHILAQNGSSISSLIALRYAEATPFALSALFAAGLALFALTLIVNFAAAVIVSQSRSGAVSEA